MHNVLYELQHQEGTFKDPMNGIVQCPPLVWLLLLFSWPLLNSSEWPHFQLQLQYLGSGNQWIVKCQCPPLVWLSRPLWIPLNGHIISLMWFAHCTLCGQFSLHSLYYIAFFQSLDDFGVLHCQVQSHLVNLFFQLKRWTCWVCCSEHYDFFIDASDWKL